MGRSVWLSLMRKVRDQRHLFYPEHLLQRLSSPLLEAAATAPGRWTSLMMSQRNYGVHHTVKKRVYSLMTYGDRLQERPAETDAFSLENLQTYLVPGGQYLVTWSGRWLALWGIGLEDAGSPPLVAVSCVKDYHLPDDRTEHRVYGMAVQATADGEGLRVLIFHHYADR